MIVVDTEVQYDRKKLTIFYFSEQRIDFRELIRDLFAVYNARIWFKKIETVTQFNLNQRAKIALTTGILLPV